MKGRCITFLKSCKSMWQLKEIQALIFSSGLQQNRDTLNKLMAVCLNSSFEDFNYALRIFNYTQHPSLFLYNLMIRAFVKRGSFGRAISLFNQLRENGVWLDNYTYPFVCKAIGSIGEVGEGEKVHAFVIKMAIEFDAYVCNSLMDMYAELGHVDFVKQMLEEMLERDVVCWNILIYGCVSCGRFREAVEIFRRMQIESKEMPNEATVVRNLTACSALSNGEVGKEIHSYIEKELNFTTRMGNALLDMYCKFGYVSVAREIFDVMIMKNVNCWTSMVTRYVNCGQLDKARDLFEEGLVEEGRELFNSMSSRYGIQPNSDHYGCFIDLLSRAWLLNEAEELISKLPDKKDEIIVPLYGYLLSACKLYGNVDMGETLAKTVAKVKSGDANLHSLLACIYATADIWEDVNKVRSKMKDLGIKKVPGCSAIAVDGIDNRVGVGAFSHFLGKIGLPICDR